LTLFGDSVVVERVGVGQIRIGGTMPNDDHVSAGAQGARKLKVARR
jgi:hypothetical protein